MKIFFREDSRKEYRKLIREISGKEEDFLEDMKYETILGSDKFVEWVQKKFIDRAEKEDAELPQKKIERIAYSAFKV